MDKYYIYGAVMFVIIVIIFILFLIKDKLKRVNYRVIESEKKILSFLESKNETLSKLKEALEKNNIDFSLKDIDFNENEITAIDFDLSKQDPLLIETFEFNVNIKFTEEELYLFSKFKTINTEMTGIKRYYNENVEEINTMLNRFPANIIGKLLKIKKKEVFEIKKEDILPLLKSSN